MAPESKDCQYSRKSAAQCPSTVCPLRPRDLYSHAIKSKMWCKVFLVLTIILQAIPCQSCGHSPFGRYEAVIKKISEKFPDRDIATLLAMVLDTNPTVLKPLLAEWKRYANCIGLVDTGYFKRSDLSAAGKNENDMDEIGRSIALSPRDANSGQRRGLKTTDKGKVVQLVHILMSMSTEV